MKVDECLKKLLSDWAFRSEREGFPTAFSENPHLPASILSRITSVEPFRAQAIEDATIHFALPMPFGFGMEIFFPETVELVPFQGWRKTIQNVSVQIEYCEHMDGTNCYRFNVNLERIGRENDDWKIIEVFSAEQRRQMRELFSEAKKNYACRENE